MIAIISFVAAYLQLLNDSSTFLYVKVYGQDGTLLTETSLAPQDFNIYSDQYAPPGNNPSSSQTPYVVHWYCSDGGTDYSICTDVSDGALVTPNSCPGSRQCPVKKTPKADDVSPNFNYGFKNPPTFPPPEDTD